MTKTNLFKRFFSWVKKHKIKSILILVFILLGGYWIKNSLADDGSLPEYTLSMAKMGSIVETVTGSGQVSASNQTDIQSLVSGTIKSINVSVGQKVKAGDLIAVIDSSNALISLENSRIAYAKITQPAKQADISITKNNLEKSYDSAFNSVASVFLDLPSLMSGMKDLLYSQDGYLSNQNSTSLTSTSNTYRQTTEKSYDIALEKYQRVMKEYETLNRSSETNRLDILLINTYGMIKSIAEATTNAQNAINFISTSQPNYKAGTLSTTLSNVTSWADQANSNVSSIVVAQNTILSSKKALDELLIGNDELDIRSSLLSLEQAQKTYENYFIRAPYDGIIGRIPVNIYGQAGSGTVIATIIGEQKIANISLNEIDASKVKVGQNVKIEFGAIDDISATGTVTVVDQIGTVSSGVVSYGVKITINTQDERIRPGMSANTTITTFQKDNVLVIPSSAIKNDSNGSYILTLDRETIRANTPSMSLSSNSTGNNAGTTSRINYRLSSSTKISSTTNQNRLPSNQANGSGFGNRSLTIRTDVAPSKITIISGKSDDTNTEIKSGLNPGEFVITKTVSNTSNKTSSTAPSILGGVGSRPGSGSLRTTMPR